MAATRQTLNWVKNGRGTPAFVVTRLEGTSETYKKGALLMYDVSETGVVECARSSGVPSVDNAYGIALEDASGTALSDQDVLIPLPGDLFAAALATDADTVIAPVAASHIGQSVGIVKLSTTGGAGTEYVALFGGGADDTWGTIVDLYKPDVEKRGGISATFSAGDRVVIQFNANSFVHRVNNETLVDGSIA